ncbi:metallo-beta-lactamase superfamily protein [Stackebrandtia albiflava]|uniref:Metallo-beta-lactamase superfamily protein n=1 Tax=Stackebrandtia albiflava TaxID=406432 RepID=A0A562UY07_9ACTN|nr:MBL fold metallo-hydrolase [Stackebrandtia albiflava]TWJ10487.1 metallo-beta-lactamase superfamily protein [Stackebrandtia albiflava]
MAVSRRIGNTEIFALTDAEGGFFTHRHDAFPAATPEQWRAADRFDPGAVTTEGRWWLQFRCFAVRTAGGVTMIDTGVGPADSPAASWAPVPGRLPEELAEVGISPDDVTRVVMTHLHTDHIGWSVTRRDDRLLPFFPNAEYLLQAAELAAVRELNPHLRHTLIAPLQEAGRLRVVDGDERLSPELRAVATPGHTPGHQSVLVDDGTDLVTITGDLLVHPIQLLYPDVAYSHESDPELARRSRVALLHEAAERHGELATPHLTEPFLRVPEGTLPSR